MSSEQHFCQYSKKRFLKKDFILLDKYEFGLANSCLINQAINLNVIILIIKLNILKNSYFVYKYS